MSRAQDNRPLSPHVGIYRWQITNTMSILHRISGVGLALGLIPLAAWLWAVAYDASLFDCLAGLFASILGKLMLMGWTLAFFYHLGNGLRHLNWDMGKGFNLDEVLASGRVAIAFALAATALTWIVIFQKVGF